jgi:hypothetical protein
MLVQAAANDLQTSLGPQQLSRWSTGVYHEHKGDMPRQLASVLLDVAVSTASCIVC